MIKDSTAAKMEGLLNGKPSRVIVLDYFGKVVSDSGEPATRPGPYRQMTEVRLPWSKLQVTASEFQEMRVKTSLRISGTAKIVTSDGWLVCTVVQHALGKATRSRRMGHLLEETMAHGIKRQVDVRVKAIACFSRSIETDFPFVSALWLQQAEALRLQTRWTGII